MKLTTLPIIKNVWARIRLRKILRRHEEVAVFWRPIIQQYFEGSIEHYNLKPQKADLANKKIIWQYWGQGFTNEIPEVVQICLTSVEKNKGDYQIIRLSDQTIAEYVDLPQFVLDKCKNPEFNKTFFSDLLRLTLLNLYGGVWLDATVFLTGLLPQRYVELDYFVFQRDSAEIHKKYWENSYAYYWGWDERFKVRMLNSVIFAKENNIIISTLLQLMLYYWKTQDHIIDYFFFQILYNELITGELFNQKCPTVSDTIPHKLQSKLGGKYTLESLTDIFNNTTIHKSTYKNTNIENFKKILNKTLS